MHLAEQFLERLANDDAVLERVSDATGRIGAARQHPPRTVRHARQVGRIEMDVHALRWRHAHQRPQELRMAEHQMRRQMAVRDQLLRAVDILQDEVVQMRALHDRGRDRLPVRRVDDERHDIELPEARLSLGVVVHIIGHAVVADHGLRRRASPCIVVRRHGGQRLGQGLPCRPDGAGIVAQFVVARRIHRPVTSGRERGLGLAHRRGKVRRRSSVCGKSGFGSSAGGSKMPPANPNGSKRASLRPSAS